MSEKVTSLLFVTFIIYIFTSASVGKISTTEFECLCKATEEFGFSFSRSKIDKTLTK